VFSEPVREASPAAHGAQSSFGRFAGRRTLKTSRHGWCDTVGRRMAAPAQGGRGNSGENSERDTGITGSAPPVAPVVHPGQRELDIGKGPPGACGDHGADFGQSSGRVVVRAWPVPHQRRPVPVVSEEMSKLLAAEVAKFLEFFAQRGQMPIKLPRQRKGRMNHTDLHHGLAGTSSLSASHNARAISARQELLPAENVVATLPGQGNGRPVSLSRDRFPASPGVSRRARRR
jgi:hypothetical protein